MTLKLYVDMMSQPCRALYIFMKMSKIPFEVVPVAIRNGEHKQETYLKLNPLGKVPSLADDDFVLTESVAIFRYLCRKFSIPDHLYPSDPKKQAKVDEYMEWQHINTRMKSAKVFMSEVMNLQNSNIPNLVQDMNVMLDELEMMFLKENKFLAGDQVSFADILAVCELMQPMISGREPLDGRTKLSSWMERVMKETQPHFEDAHSIFYRVRRSVMKRRSRL